MPRDDDDESGIELQNMDPDVSSDDSVELETAAGDENGVEVDVESDDEEDDEASDDEPEMDKAAAGKVILQRKGCLGGPTLCMCCGGPVTAKMAALAFAVFAAVTIASTLILPETVSCHEEDVKYFVVKTETPDLQAVYPPMVCTWYEDQTITVVGENFQTYNEHIPEFEIQVP